ncbi:MAG: hypothetical protein ACFE8N_08415, partial [Promethearchaeota archaeon]
MKIDNSNKRYSTIFAGILVILVLSILVAFLIGCGDHNIYNQDKVKIASKKANLSPDCYRLGRDGGKSKDVPVAQDFCWLDIDTERGTMEWKVVLDGIEWKSDTGYVAEEFEIPLCIKDIDDISDANYDLLDPSLWYIEVIVTGGYEPKAPPTYLNRIKFTQKDGLEGYVDVIWDQGQYVGPCCTGWKYTGVMSVVLDTNNDGIVNQADILPLGLHWLRTGP